MRKEKEEVEEEERKSECDCVTQNQDILQHLQPFANILEEETNKKNANSSSSTS